MTAADIRAVASGLILASQATDRVPLGDRALLLDRAADMLAQVSGPADRGLGSMAARLRGLAANVEDYPAGAIGAAMSDAAQALVKMSALAERVPEGSS